jgi:phage portal protein BeeE
MTAGDFGYIDLGMSPVDLALISDSQATKRDICDIFHVPSILFNDPEGTTYNNQQEVRKRAWTDAIMPECDHFADEFTRHAKNAYKSEGDIWVVADYSAIEELQADKREMIEWLDRAWWIKGSKKQEIMGMEPDEELDKYFIPMGLVPSDELNIDPTIFEQAKEENLDYFRKKD